jgi:hypothetical protein
MLEAVTVDERSQIMGHRNSSIYRQYYMLDFIERDCQAIYLGVVPQDDLVRRVGQLYRDLRAPTALTEAQRLEVRNDAKLLRLRQKRDKVAKRIEKHYSTIKAAEGTRRHTRYQKLKARIDSKRKRLLRRRMKKATEDFFATINTEDVNEQLRGIHPSNEVFTPSTISYVLEERATIVKLFHECIDDLEELQLFKMRMEITRNLVILCGRRESQRTKIQHRTTHDKSSNAIQSRDVVAKTNISNPDEQFCPFCRCGLFRRIDSLCRHVRSLHLKNRRPNKEFNCPYQGCRTWLDCETHFLNHRALEHGLCL